VPAEGDYCHPYENVAIQVHHGTILCDIAGDTFHAVSTVILWINGLRVILNLYNYSPNGSEMSLKSMYNY